MLSDNERKSIIGLAVESVIEKGDAMAILQETVKDEFNIAVMALRSRWKKITHILMDHGAWITTYEAKQLLEIFLKNNGIMSDELLDEVIDTDQDLYIWSQRNYLPPSPVMTEEQKKDHNRRCFIGVIIQSQMIDTMANQEQAIENRHGIIFKQELLKALDKIRLHRVRTNLSEFKEILGQVMPLLPQARISEIDKYFKVKLKNYMPQEITFKPKEPEDAKAVSIALKILKREELSKEEVDDIDKYDQLFDDIQLPSWETKQEAPEGEGPSIKITMESRLVEISARGIVNYLKEKAADLQTSEAKAHEIQEKATEELRNIKKYCRDLDKLPELWKIMKGAESHLSKEYREFKDKPETSESRVIAALLSAVAMYKIELGCSREWFERVKSVVTVQSSDKS